MSRFHKQTERDDMTEPVETKPEVTEVDLVDLEENQVEAYARDLGITIDELRARAKK